MDCGIPFCHQGCPLGNLIPEWNDLVYRDDWDAAIERLHATNNFPEFTGRLCPAPCETACVLGINQDPVTIKNVEVSIIDQAWDDRLRQAAAARAALRQDRRRHRLRPGRPGRRPAAHPGRAHGRGLRARRPHRRPAALRHPRVQDGEAVLDRRLEQMRREGTIFRAGVEVGERPHRRQPARALRRGRPGRRRHRRPRPAGARARARRHPPGDGVPAAGQQGRRATTSRDQITAAGKHVVIIGGGDTGADCLGTAHRQGAASVTQLEIMPQPPARPPGAPALADLPDDLPGHLRPRGGRRAGLRRVDTRSSSATTTATCARCTWSRWIADGSSRSRAPSARSRRSWSSSPWASPAPRADGLVEQLGVELDERGNVARDAAYATNVAGRLRRRRRRPRPVADRLGDRRGPGRGRGCRPLPDRRDQPARADPPHGTPAGGLSHQAPGQAAVRYPGYGPWWP